VHRCALPLHAQVKKPCGPSPTLAFVQESSSASWYAKPSRSAKLKAGQGLPECQALCNKYAAGSKGCAALGMSVNVGKKSNTTYCDVYYKWVPQRLCAAAADAKKFKCGRPSLGSWRSRWVYT
jgi:hypothetical protein